MLLNCSGRHKLQVIQNNCHACSIVYRSLQGVRLLCALALWCLMGMAAATTPEMMQFSLASLPLILLQKQILQPSAMPLNRAWWICMMWCFRMDSKQSYKSFISGLFQYTCSTTLKPGISTKLEPVHYDVMPYVIHFLNI